MIKRRKLWKSYLWQTVCATAAIPALMTSAFLLSLFHDLLGPYLRDL